MLTPEQLDDLKPEFEKIHQHLTAAFEESEGTASDVASGHFIAALAIMEVLVERVSQEQGHSVTEALKRVADAANSAEGAGVAGGVAGAASALAFTGLGGFGVAAGGTAVGVAGLTGAAVASGGAALAGAAALYLTYKGGAAALETDLGQRVANVATEAGRIGAEQVVSAGKRTKEGLTQGINRIRTTRIRFESTDEDDKDSQPAPRK